MKFLRFHVAAGREVRGAARFYGERQPGLDRRWLTAVEDAVERIRRHPAVGRIETPKARKYRLPDFPYYFIFEDRRDYIYVMAVMHEHRNPDDWKSRT